MGGEGTRAGLRTAGPACALGTPPLGSRSPPSTRLSQDSLRAGRSRPRAVGWPRRRPRRGPSSTPARLLHDLPPSKLALQRRAPLGPHDPPEPRPSGGATSSPARVTPALTGLGRVAVHGIGRDVHLLHARVLPACQGAHGRCARAALGASPRPLAPRPERGSAARRGRLGLGLGLGVAALAAGSPRRAAHHPPPGPAAAPLRGGLRAGRGRRRLRPRDVSGGSVRGPRRPRPMAWRGGSGRAAPANGRRDAAEPRGGAGPRRVARRSLLVPARVTAPPPRVCARGPAGVRAPLSPTSEAARGFPARRQPSPAPPLGVRKAHGRKARRRAPPAPELWQLGWAREQRVTWRWRLPRPQRLSPKVLCQPHLPGVGEMSQGW